MKSIEESRLNLKNKIVLVRLDLNVPLNNGKITDTNRIDKIIPTLKYLIGKKAKLLLISHVGRPKGKVVDSLSLEPIKKSLSEKLDEPIKLIKENIFKLEKKNIFNISKEKILLLENIRFYIEEEQNDQRFAKHLAGLCDIYVNEAFSCSHRKHASVCEITKYLKKFGGMLLSKELNALKKITNIINKPISCIIGGSKISTKINIIENLIPKIDNMIIVGGMANNFLKFEGINIGKSVYEKNIEKTIKKIIDLAKKNSCKLIYPKDFAVGKNFNDNAIIKEKNKIENDDMILDIGNNSINEIKSVIYLSKTILWNGPAGYFENNNFAKGSFAIAKAIAEKTKEGKIYSVVGGGDTVAVLNKLNLFNNFNFVSTAGGAFLEYLEGKELPGIKALN